MFLYLRRHTCKYNTCGTTVFDIDTSAVPCLERQFLGALLLPSQGRLARARQTLATGPKFLRKASCSITRREVPLWKREVRADVWATCQNTTLEGKPRENTNIHTKIPKRSTKMPIMSTRRFEENGGFHRNGSRHSLAACSKECARYNGLWTKRQHKEWTEWSQNRKEHKALASGCFIAILSPGEYNPQHMRTPYQGVPLKACDSLCSVNLTR